MSFQFLDQRTLKEAKMKVNLSWIVLASLVSTVACGGKKEEDSKPTKQSATQECQKICDQAAECEGAPSDYAAECDEGCENAVETADELGCLEQIDVLVNCSGKEFSCDPTEAVCEGEAMDFVTCVLDEEDEWAADAASSCHDTCALAAECESAPAGYEEECNQACDELAESAVEDGCEDEFEVLMHCGELTFECGATTAGCDDEVEEYSACVSN